MRKPDFESDGVQLYLGDCKEIMAEMPSASANLVLTSPPYDNVRDYDGFSWDFYGIARELVRLLVPGGVYRLGSR